jgi:hypothetical protein
LRLLRFRVLIGSACIISGYGVSPDPSKALHLFELAAAAGDAEAQWHSGVYYIDRSLRAAAVSSAQPSASASAGAGAGAGASAGASAGAGAGAGGDAAVGVEWVSQAVRSGHARAAVTLARCYEVSHFIVSAPLPAADHMHVMCEAWDRSECRSKACV